MFTGKAQCLVLSSKLLHCPPPTNSHAEANLEELLPLGINVINIYLRHTWLPSIPYLRWYLTFSRAYLDSWLQSRAIWLLLNPLYILTQYSALQRLLADDCWLTGGLRTLVLRWEVLTVTVSFCNSASGLTLLGERFLGGAAGDTFQMPASIPGLAPCWVGSLKPTPCPQRDGGSCTHRNRHRSEEREEGCCINC